MCLGSEQPTQNKSKCGNLIFELTESKSTTLQSEAKSSQSKATTVQCGGTPMQREATPGQSDAISMHCEDMSAQFEAAVVQSECTPPGQSEAPEQCEGTPAFETTSMQYEDTPVQSVASMPSNQNSDQIIESCFCCSSTSEISQPTDSYILAKTQRSYGTGKNTHNRCFIAVWYKTYPWLHLCRVSLKAFCYYCKYAKFSHAITSNKAERAFSEEGFCNWKKALDRFKAHELSHAHRDALFAFNASKSKPIGHQLQKQSDEITKKRRESLLKQLRVLRSLLRQGIPIRNDHAGGSNLSVILDQVAAESAWVNECKYQSPLIVNEQIKIMANKVLRSLLNDIQPQCLFSLLADETRDVSNREQLIICIGWVSDSYEVHEDAVGLVQLENTTAETIYIALKNALLALGLQFENCRGQGYDGASNFQGHLTGVGRRFEDNFPSAIPVHCLAHCINLSVQQVAHKVKSIKEGLNFAMDMIQLIKLSPKREVVLEKVKQQQELSSNASKVKSLCPTRWTARTGAMQAIIDNYVPLRETMEISSHGMDDCSRRANGMLSLMDKFSTYFGLKLSILIFSMIEQLSINLQAKETNVDDCFLAVDLCIKSLERLRTDVKFKSFYDTVALKASEVSCDPPVLPRQRQVPRRLDDGAPQHSFSSVEEYYRKEYFEAIDTVKGDLHRRFQQENFLFIRSVEALLIDSANGRNISLSPRFKKLYKNDIDMDKLIIHLEALQDVVRSAHLDNIAIKQVTRVNTLCDIFNNQPCLKTIFTEIHTLLRLYLTIPVTTASAERSFSALKRIKTYLRNTMTQERLNHCMLLHMHHEKTDELDLVHVAREFVSVCERRKNFFGNF